MRRKTVGIIGTHEVNAAGVADDGTPEALSVAGAPGFALGVQWHAEWEPWQGPVNGPLWRAFGETMRARPPGRVN